LFSISEKRRIGLSLTVKFSIKFYGQRQILTLVTETFLLMASADFGYCVFILQLKNSWRYLSGLPQNHIFRGLTFVNPAADWKIIVVRIFMLLSLTL